MLDPQVREALENTKAVAEAQLQDAIANREKATRAAVEANEQVIAADAIIAAIDATLKDSEAPTDAKYRTFGEA